MGRCLKCACKGFFWNPVSAVEKGWDNISGNNRDDRGYRVCTCGHHWNAHE